MNSVVSFWQCASAIDSLAAFYFNNITNITAGDNPPSPAALNLARHIGELPSLFPQVCDANFVHHILKG
jgi:exportin-7